MKGKNVEMKCNPWQRLKNLIEEKRCLSCFTNRKK